MLMIVILSFRKSDALSNISLRVFRHFALGFSQNTTIALPSLPEWSAREVIWYIAPLELICVYTNRSTPVIRSSSTKMCGIWTQIIY